MTDLFAGSLQQLLQIPREHLTDRQKWRIRVFRKTVGENWRPFDRIYWKRYAVAAEKSGLVDQEHQKRISETKDEPFFQTLHEFMAVWYFSRKLRFKVSSGKAAGAKGKNPDLVIRKRRQEIVVEIKTPIRQTKAAIWAGDDSVLIRRNIRNAANQLSQGVPNLILLTPMVRVHLTWDKNQLLKALLGEQISTGTYVPQTGKVVNIRPKFNPSGSLFDPRFSHVSAVACLESYYTDRLHHAMLIVHNPIAGKPICPDLFPGTRQLIWETSKTSLRSKWLV